MTFLKSLADDVRILLILAAFWLPVMLMCGVYTFRDARRFGKNRILWALISFLAPCLIGFIAYLITRNPEGREVEGAKPTGNLLQGILLSVLLIPAILLGTLAWVMDFTEGNLLFLTRYDTDMTLTNELLDPEYLRTDSWRTITRTNADGSSVEVQQYFGNIRITWTASDGTAETRIYDVAYGGTMKGPWGRYANLEGDHYREITGNYYDQTNEGEGSYFFNDEGQLYLFQIQSDREPEHNHCVTLSYDAAGRITKQQFEFERREETGSLLQLTPEEAQLHYDLYTYDPAGKIIRSERYNHENVRMSHTEYLWSMDDTIRIARTYTPDGVMTETSVSSFDREGRLQKQEFYDGTGALTHRVEFDSDVVAFLLLDATTMMLIFLWAIVMVITILMLLQEKKK